MVPPMPIIRKGHNHGSSKVVILITLGNVFFWFRHMNFHCPWHQTMDKVSSRMLYMKLNTRMKLPRCLVYLVATGYDE